MSRLITLARCMRAAAADAKGVAMGKAAAALHSGSIGGRVGQALRSAYSNVMKPGSVAQPGMGAVGSRRAATAVAAGPAPLSALSRPAGRGMLGIGLTSALRVVDALRAGEGGEGSLIEGGEDDDTTTTTGEGKKGRIRGAVFDAGIRPARD